MREGTPQVFLNIRGFSTLPCTFTSHQLTEARFSLNQNISRRDVFWALLSSQQEKTLTSGATDPIQFFFFFLPSNILTMSLGSSSKQYTKHLQGKEFHTMPAGLNCVLGANVLVKLRRVSISKMVEIKSMTDTFPNQQPRLRLNKYWYMHLSTQTLRCVSH